MASPPIAQTKQEKILIYTASVHDYMVVKQQGHSGIKTFSVALRAGQPDYN